ncbi:MAG: sterol desaturase family protein, partial [Acidimicrobiales bacterium]
WVAHWADHHFTALWRMHALHHSQEELSVLTSFRAHPLSHLPGFLLASIPAFVLTGHRGITPQLVTAYVCLGTIPHANLRWSFGPLGKLFVSPSYHRLHHAVDGPAGMNLGVVLTLWDVLAGRARFPDRRAPAPRTGLAGRPVPVEQAAGSLSLPRLLLRQLCDPFRSLAVNDRS